MKSSTTPIFVVLPLGLASLWIASQCTPAVAQVSGSVPSYVKLQSNTPGTAQTGHLNVTGTAIASQFQGGGAGVTGVNADKLDGLDSTAFLTGVPNPLVLTNNLAGGKVLSVTNTSSLAGSVAIYGESTATNNDSAAGWFVNRSSNGKAVLGSSIATSGPAYGGYFQTSSTSGRAVYGLASASSGSNYGGYFATQSPNGTACYALSSGMIGLEAFATATSGFTYGGRLISNSTSGMGLYAAANAATGATYGAYIENYSASGYGIYATSKGTHGIYAQSEGTVPLTYGGYFVSNSINGRGVYAYTSANNATDIPYGVLGLASPATLGYGVYASGDLGASGVKSFRIDDPRDPENRYLLHYSSESPFPQNFYVGTVRTDGAGYAWVELPDYFADINANVKYQLTVVDSSDDFVLAKVCNEVQDNKFRIRTSKPNVKVSWQVMADRNDERIRFNRPTDVRMKTGVEKGTLQHPEFYGLGPERGMNPLPPSRPGVARTTGTSGP